MESGEYAPGFTAFELLLIILALPRSAWIQVEPSAVEVDGGLEVLDVSELGGHALDPLDLTVESLAHRVVTGCW